jgi:transposase-like protein
MARFVWSEEKKRAALLLAEAELPVNAIAEDVGISPQALWKWRQHPEFDARVKDHRERIRDEVMACGVADRVVRVRALNSRWRRMNRVIEQRAAAPELQDVPGGDTGLIVHNVKGVGKGDDFQLIDLYEVDTGLLSELRNTEKQAAQEVGQWLDKLDMTSDGQAVAVHYVNDWRSLPSQDPPALPAPGADRG